MEFSFLYYHQLLSASKVVREHGIENFDDETTNLPVVKRTDVLDFTHYPSLGMIAPMWRELDSLSNEAIMAQEKERIREDPTDDGKVNSSALDAKEKLHNLQNRILFACRSLMKTVSKYS